MTPLVSVIIPSFDRPLLLKRRSIPSVLRQTHAHWEVIVVGDGPEGDSVRRAVDSFGDARIRYAEIRRPDYAGLADEGRRYAAGASARNYGLELARGDIIAPLDDDDEFLPNHLADSVDALCARNADFVYGYVFVRDIELGRDRKQDWLSWTDPTTRALFLERNIIFHSSVAYSRGFAHLLYPTDGRIPADYGLWLAIHQAGARFASIDTPQAICYGDNRTSQIRLSVPSLVAFEELADSFARIHDSRTLSNTGPLCAELETRIGARLGVPRAVSTPSGDLGLLMALRALYTLCGRTREEVILPSYAHPSLVNAALWSGFVPVFCDIDPATLCMTPGTVEPLVGPKTALIAALHPHGYPCDMPALERLARASGVELLGDAASAFGAQVGGRPIGAWGTVEVFSLSGTKSLTAGEGGLVCSRDDGLLRIVRLIGRYGMRDDYVAETLGINGKLGEFPAALALSGLARIDQWLLRRRAAEATYRNLLADVPGLRFPRLSAPTSVSACKDAVLILDSPGRVKRLRERLSAYQIDSRPYYRPLHRMPAYVSLRRSDLPATEALADCTLCIPLYNEIRDEVIDFVADVVHEALGRIS